MQLVYKNIGDPCPRCASPLVRRKDCFFWCGMYGDAAYCENCNGAWEIDGEAVLGRAEPRNVSIDADGKVSRD